LPNKLYVGISELKTFDIQFTTNTEYNSIADTFEEIDISTDTRFTAIKGLLLDFLKQQKYISGLKISLFVESQQGL
jgi:hypothetical protein